jgi:RND superfamily putative drug exporter
VIGDSGRAAEIRRAITATPGVVSAGDAGPSTVGLHQWAVILDAPPASSQAFKTVAALRESVKMADPSAIVGGSDAQALDARDAVRDRQVLIPAILGVVLIVLYVLLRAALAPLVLLAVMVLSALSALGLGGWASVHVLRVPALDYATPLFAFLFLVALGVEHDLSGSPGTRRNLHAPAPASCVRCRRLVR